MAIIFDLPGQRWIDCDHPMAKGQVGFSGTSISSLQDMEDLFEGIPIDKIRVSIIALTSAPILMAMFIAAAEKRGLNISQLKGDLQNDPLKEFEGLGAGFPIFPVRPALKLSLDAMEYIIKHMPGWTPVTVNGHCVREYQITAAMEAAVVLSNAKEYIKGLVARDLSVDECAPRLGFFVATNHHNFFQEIAKFRAYRYLWAKMIKDEFGAKEPGSCVIRLGTLNIGTYFTRQHPINNITRITLQVLASVLGGCQSVNTMGYDEALALPAEDAQYTSLCIQNIIADETGIPDTADPLGGSYYMESLTKAMREKITEWVQKIEATGGVVAAIEKGFFEREIVGKNESLKRWKEVESGERIVIGLNKFQADEEEEGPLPFRHNPAYEEEQKKKLAAFKGKRDLQRVESSLRELEDVARRGHNIMPGLVKAVKQGATVGETGAVLKKVYELANPRFTL